MNAVGRLLGKLAVNQPYKWGRGSMTSPEFKGGGDRFDHRQLAWLGSGDLKDGRDGLGEKRLRAGRSRQTAHQGPRGAFGKVSHGNLTVIRPDADCYCSIVPGAFRDREKVWPLQVDQSSPDLLEPTVLERVNDGEALLPGNNVEFFHQRFETRPSRSEEARRSRCSSRFWLVELPGRFCAKSHA